jgi:hypothetical protein
MNRAAEPILRAAVEALCREPDARLTVRGDGTVELRRAAGTRMLPLASDLVTELAGRGLIVEGPAGCFAAASTAVAWLRRQAAKKRGEDGFRAQHGELAQRDADVPGASVVVDLDESPVAALARPRGGAAAWLAPHAVAAAERLRRDFERARLQPRVTANLSTPVHTGRRAAGQADLADTTIAARRRVDDAMRAVGPEFAGALLDVCCFLKGLETVERERCWPARSAKLVLRLGLEALARHYGLSPMAAGPKAARKLRQWGTEDYRPSIS